MMNVKNEKNPLLWLFTSLAFIAVFVMAGLQYRWLDGHRVWQQQQMQGNLQRITSDFADEFNTTIQLFVNELQLPSSNISYSYSVTNTKIVRKKRDGISYSQIVLDRFTTAISKLNHDGLKPLIDSIYFVRKSSSGILELQKYSTDNQQLSPITPGNQLSLFLKSLEDYVYKIKDLRPLPKRALVVELPFLAIASEPRVLTVMEDIDNSIVWTIVKLDADYLKNQWIPALLNEAASGQDRDVYSFRINNSESGDEIYSNTTSEQSWPADHFDVKESLFKINSQIVASNSSPQVVESYSSNVVVQKEEPEVINQISDPLQGLLTSLSDKKSTFSYGNSIVSINHYPDPTQKTSSNYFLLANHQEGSIFLASRKGFILNLFMSYSIFLLLLISFAVLYYSILKAKKASLQQLNFVNSISHELKTPLAVICTAGENLKDNLVKDEKGVQYYGEVIYREGAKLHELVDQVLDYSGQKSGRAALELKDVPIIEVVERAIEENRMILEEKGFNVKVDVPDKNISARIDKYKIASALKILVSNALKYSGESRTIEISVSQISGKGEFTTRIAVVDFGIGIPEKEFDQLFVPFFRGDKVRETGIHGTGLGLSLAKEIVSLHNGKLEFCSREGVGSTFTISLKQRR